MVCVRKLHHVCMSEGEGVWEKARKTKDIGSGPDPQPSTPPVPKLPKVAIAVFNHAMDTATEGLQLAVLVGVQDRQTSTVVLSDYCLRYIRDFPRFEIQFEALLPQRSGIALAGGAFCWFTEDPRW